MRDCVYAWILACVCVCFVTCVDPMDGESKPPNDFSLCEHLPDKGDEIQDEERGRARRLEDQSLQMAFFVNKSLLGKTDAHADLNCLSPAYCDSDTL